jgi:hypothetical protein
VPTTSTTRHRCGLPAPSRPGGMTKSTDRPQRTLPGQRDHSRETVSAHWRRLPYVRW